ncbi:MAG TPA: hypothetical protein VEJ63_16690 [Planctomycetota bacterium]|nr:hypothetical protein [Planctomycetota bacterium]
MPTQVMRKKAADNVYHHPDFHGGLSYGLEYLQDHYGPDAVREYLRQFTRTFFSPLRKEIDKRGLEALRDHFTKLYKDEGGEATITLNGNELIVDIAECPAVKHLRKRGHVVARMWSETSRTVNETLVEGTPFAAELVSYEEQTGRSIQRFYRRRA